jgi:sugar phosphate isomerase/epimerase
MISIPTHALSISDKAFSKDDLTTNLQALGENGFTHLHFAHRWTHPEPMPSEEVESWQSALTETSINVLDVHGCHPKNIHLWSTDPENRSKALQRLIHRLRITKALGGDAMVYHVPYHVEPTEQVLNWFIDGLRRAEELARELGITIGLENHYHEENDKRALGMAFEVFDSDYIGFTFDSGHALISGNFQWIMENCGPRLHILHLNDNDGLADHHWNPYDPNGLADWDRIARFIRESPYRKPIQLEVSWSPEHHGTHGEFLQAAAQAAHWIVREVSMS